MEIALFASVGCVLALVAVLAYWLRQQQTAQRAHEAALRQVGGAAVEGLAQLKGRLTQVELQLGRTMRHAGVPGQDP